MPSPNFVIAGNPGPTLKASEPSYNVETGLSYREIWTGTKAACLSKLAYYAGQGLNGTMSKVTGGGWQLVITIPDVFYQRWELDTEWEQVDLFSAPEVEAEMAEWTGGRSSYKKTIQDAVESGDEPDFGPFPMAFVIYRALARGQEAYERRRPVLRRRRVIPIGYTADVMVLETKENVYSTSAVVGFFGVPNLVAQQLPQNPALTPVDCVWAWKTRTQSSDYMSGRNRIEEQTELVFAAWNMYFYNYIDRGPLNLFGP